MHYILNLLVVLIEICRVDRDWTAWARLDSLQRLTSSSRSALFCGLILLVYQINHNYNKCSLASTSPMRCSNPLSNHRLHLVLLIWHLLLLYHHLLAQGEILELGVQIKDLGKAPDGGHNLDGLLVDVPGLWPPPERPLRGATAGVHNLLSLHVHHSRVILILSLLNLKKYEKIRMSEPCTYICWFICCLAFYHTPLSR